MRFSVLNIATVERKVDGTQKIVRISLLGDKTALQEYKPAMPQYRSGGALVPLPGGGSQPTENAWEDVQDRLTIDISARRPGTTIRTLRRIGALLVKAVQYWTTEYQNEPVWLEARATGDTAMRYALVKTWSLPQHNNPYTNPFVGWQESALVDLDLTIVHVTWESASPAECKEGEEVRSSDYGHLCFELTRLGYVDYGNDVSLANLPTGVEGFEVECWARFGGNADEVQFIVLKSGWALMFAPEQGLYGSVQGTLRQAYSIGGLEALDGRWHHLAMVFNPADKQIYLAVDGKWLSSYIARGPQGGIYNDDRLYKLWVGTTPWMPEHQLNGAVMNLLVYSAPRHKIDIDFIPMERCAYPISEINPVTTRLATVIAQNHGSIVLDRSRHGNHGTMYGAVQWQTDCMNTIAVSCNCVGLSSFQELNYTGWQVCNTGPDDTINAMLRFGDTMIACQDRGVSGACVWYTIDGISWNAATTTGMGNCKAMVRSGEYVYLVSNNTTTGQVTCYRSDDGNTWTLRSADVAEGAASVGRCSIAAMPDGTLYIACTTGIYRSADGGTTWTRVHGGAPCRSVIYHPEHGCLYATRPGSGGPGSVSALLISHDGTTWNVVTTCDEYQLYEAYYDDANGWLLISCFNASSPMWYLVVWYDGKLIVIERLDITRNPTGVARDGEGRRYLSFGDGSIFVSSDDWLVGEASGSVGGWAAGLTYYSPTDCLYVGSSGCIYRFCNDPIRMGCEETCTDEVMIANKQNTAQLTNIKVYDSGAGIYYDVFPGDTAYYLLPPSCGAGDMVYFGITSGTNSGPFSSLVFDLETAMDAAAYAAVWEYYNGTWTALDTVDETDLFRRVGVGVVSFRPPTDWSTATVDGVTAWWVRLRVTALTDRISVPIQAGRHVYTVVRPCFQIDDDEIGGDLDALARILLRNRCDDEEEDVPLTRCNRVLAGLRSDERGPHFVMCININSQNPYGISVSGCTLAYRPDVPSYRYCQNRLQSLTEYTDISKIRWDHSIARSFYGRHRIFLRCALKYHTSPPGSGVPDEVWLRMRFQNGRGGTGVTTDAVQFAAMDDASDNYNDFTLLDFGTVQFPVSSHLDDVDWPDSFGVYIQAKTESSTSLWLYLYDLIIVPADEWIADVSDVAFVSPYAQRGGHVEKDYRLDVDGIWFRKRGRRALVRGRDDAISAVYQFIAPSPPVLHPHQKQSVYVLSASGYLRGKHRGLNNADTLSDNYVNFIRAGVRVGDVVYNLTDGSQAVITAVTTTTVGGELGGGTDNDWDSGDQYIILCPYWHAYPHIIHSVQAQATYRYLSLRGDAS
jgi:hypothetical protein